MKLPSLLAISVILTLLPSVAAQTCGGYGGMMNGCYGAGFMFLGWVVTILVIFLIIAVIYWLIKSARNHSL